MVWMTLQVELRKFIKEDENGNEEGRKGGSFSKWNLSYSLKIIDIQHGFYLIFTKIYSRKKNNLDFPKYQLKDI